jgi:2-beta-glucuronyltransferase
MAASFRWAGGRLFFVPQGIRKEDYAAAGANPYAGGRNAVSVGSMLFDPEFFAHAAARFPDVKFHVIGAGMQFSAPGNVVQYPEMPFRATLPYVRYANLGIAPYRPAPDCEYISDTSMKLLQYEYCGLPAVCPAFAAGDNPNRFGYAPGDPQSIAAAVEAALAHRQLAPRRFLGWEDIARRLLNPRGFADTAL